VKFFLKILSFFIITSLATPVGVFAGTLSVLSPLPKPAVAAPQIVAVMAVTPKQTVILKSPVASSCSAIPLMAANLVQNFGAINLNQPASCFNLVSAPKPAVPPALAVVPIHPLAKIIVPSRNRITELPSLVPGPAEQNSAVPVLVFVASSVILFEEKKSVQKAAIWLSKRIIKSLNIHQLGILRC